MSAVLTAANIRTVIEAISPTNTECRKKFHWVDPSEISPDATAGLARAFAVRWLESNPDLEPTDMAERIAEFDFSVEVVYPAEYPLDKLSRVVLSDRGDLVRALRDPANFNTDCFARVRLRDELSKDSDFTWLLRQVWRCTVRETD